MSLFRVIALVSLFTIALVSIGFKQSPQYHADRDFGVVGGPQTTARWAQTVIANPTMPAEFEAWSKNRTLASNFEKAKNNDYTRYFITWEPWQTVPAQKGLIAQSSRQPLYSNREIARGSHDEYIRRFARSIATSGLETVYIRYAHEMNGDWYPWYRDTAAYVAAWRHIVTIFKEEGATNVRFVFSINPNLYQPDDAWLANIEKYYPGDEYVDYIGMTMINFGGENCPEIPCSTKQKYYSVQLFRERAELLQSHYQKAMVLSEVNTSIDAHTATWLEELTSWVATDASIQAVVISQQESRGALQMKTGNLSWSIADTPGLHYSARRLARAIAQPVYTTPPENNLQALPLLTPAK